MTKTKQHDIGVIVGRFQIDELHDAHVKLIQDVCDRHNRCLVCVGVSPTLGSKEHPLDFPTRQAMILDKFPNVVVMPILDSSSDEIWSQNLDTIIKTVFPVGSVCLYGGRDSFIPYYKGKYDCYEFPNINYKPASDVRAEIGRKSLNTSDFRKGVIYSTQNLFPRVFFTVDIAIVTEDYQKILLGRKKDQTLFRFPGGFVDQKESLEQAAIRESKEETNADIRGIEYIVSCNIDDWRYIKTSDSVTSAFFLGECTNPEQVKANDDLVEIKWFDLNKELTNHIVDNHKVFLEKLLIQLS